jgi:transcriptional regulator with XRE-family HTH domain
MSDIGREIKRLREERSWTQAQLAVYAESSQPTVNQVESGKRNPSTRTLEKLARALGVEVSVLFPKAQSALPLEDADGRRALEEARAEAREETLRAMEEQDAALGKNLAGLLDQQLQWQIEKLRSRLDRAESPGARNDAAKDFGDWYFSSSLWIEQIRRHLPKIRVPELVRAKEAARVAVGEFAPNFTSPQRHEEITHKLAGIEDATAARDTPPTGPSRRVVFRGGPSWGEQAADPTEAEAPTKGA